MKEALRFGKEMLKELKTSDLTPRNYYDLYMKVLDELRYLEEFFMGLQRNGTAVSELYEQVQSCGMVLPRLYLLVTVGSVYIQSRQAPAKDILKDLVEMAKGVQHPMRGLFLRNYLAHVARDKLPDAQPISASRDQYQARTEHQGAARSVAKRGRREGDALQGVKVTRTESRVPGIE